MPYPRTMGVAEILDWFRGRRVSEPAPYVDDFVPTTVLDRALTDDEGAALRWILWLEDFPGAEGLRAQVPHVRTTFGRTTELDLEVTDADPAAIGNGILPVDALVVGDDEEPIGFISVWVRAGYLSSIEYSWFTDRMPRVFPSSDQLRLMDWATPTTRAK